VLEQRRFKILREFGETLFTINVMRKGNVGNLVVKALKEFAP
jgi:hypothetical protein